MSNRDHSTFGLDRRAVSEVVGYTLLIGITTVTVVALLIAATSLHGALQGSAETESVEQEMQDVDATFGRIAQGDNRSSVRVRTETSNRLSIVREGQVSVTVNDNCSVQVPLSSIRHEKDGETFANELGGTIRVTDGGQAMVSPPDLHFENGTVDLTITNLTGRTASSMTFVKDVNSSMGATETDQILFNGTCSRPDNVTVSVTSEFADAWKRYAEEEFPAGTVNRAGDTVNITLTTKHLPEAADPANNTVVDFTNGSHYELNETIPSVMINKSDANNSYSVRMTPLHEGMQVTRVAETEVDTQFYRKGIDVVFVLDESGSMDWDDPNGDRKLNSMVNASQSFLGYLNFSKDRAATVGYTDDFYDNAKYHKVNGEYFTNNFTAMNETLESDIQALSGTHINRGLYYMNSLYDLDSNFSRQKIAVLLTDGENDDEYRDGLTLDEATLKWAEEAAENDIQIYTVGFGEDSYIDDDLLNDVASTTDANYYYAENRSELEKVFNDIAKSITSRKKVVHDPSSMKLASGGNVFRPKIPTSPDYVANYSGFPNVNDPSAGANFSITFEIENGEPMNLTAYQYECEEWELTGDVKVNETHGDQYYVTRCAEINDSKAPTEFSGSDIHVYTSDNSTSDVKDDLGETKWFQENLSAVLEKYNDSGMLDLKSNQAIVGINYSNGRRMLLLLEIGRNPGENDLTYIVDVGIDDVEVQEKDE